MNKVISKNNKNIDLDESLSKFIRPAKIELPPPKFTKDSKSDGYYVPRKKAETKK